MNNRFLIPAMVALMGVSAGALADKPEPGSADDDVTISLMPAPEDNLPEAVTNRIPLPNLEELVGNDTAKKKVENAVKALEKAEQRGTDGRNHGWDHANAAREQASDMADNVKANRENRGRSELPERPDPPGPPDAPPGRP